MLLKTFQAAVSATSRRNNHVIIIVLATLFSFSIFFTSTSCVAQTQPVYAGSDIGLLLQKLNKTASVLYFAAHPDDENNRLLSFLGRGRSLRTAYLALNRGEGGQNLIGDEQGDALGLIRTNELLGARSVDGASQFFTRAVDFGYSKNPEETFRIWNRDSVLSDAVWVIRTFRPDVIIDRFPTTGEGGHGHHTASAILSVEAMLAAADPHKFPEQLKTLQPWKVTRLLWNTFNFGGMNTQAPDQYQLNVGGYNSLLGKSYGELAAEGRSFHKSQGFGSAATRGTEFEFMKLIKGAAITTDLFDGIDTGWNRITGSTLTAKWSLKAAHDFQPLHPEAILPDLLNAYRSLTSINDPFWQNEKRQELTALIQACSGIWISATTAEGYWSYRSNIPVNLSIIKRISIPATLSKLTLNGRPVALTASLPFNILQHTNAQFAADSTLETQPYWLKNPHQYGGYNLKGLGNFRSFPVNPAAITARFSLEIGGTAVVFSTPVLFHSVSPATGESYQPLRIVPPVSIQPREQLLVFKPGQDQIVNIRLTSYEDKLSGVLEIKLPRGYRSGQISRPYTFSHKGEKTDIQFTISLDPAIRHNAEDSISFSTNPGGTLVNQTVHDLEYTHIPHINWLSPAVVKVISPALEIPAASLAYIAGAGDQIPAMLVQLGYKVSMLTDRQLAEDNLDQFDAIITGVRAYNTRPALRDNQAKLMQYIKSGGCLIQQYNRPNDLVTENLGPYPFQISARRITDEFAPVSFTDPASRLLNYPNKISADDFKGWIQERAIYVPVNADAHYTSPLSMNDPGEPALPNTLMYAPYGKGAYVYTGLVFFRQLPAGVPGAIRLFVNLINAAKNKK